MVHLWKGSMRLVMLCLVLVLLFLPSAMRSASAPSSFTVLAIPLAMMALVFYLHQERCMDPGTEKHLSNPRWVTCMYEE